MAQEEEDSLSLLSLKDFEERGIAIDSKWSALDALVAVTSLASKKLQEESIRKEKQKKPADDQSNVRFPALKKPVADDLYSKKALGFYGKYIGDAMKVRIRVPDHMRNNGDDADCVGESSKRKKKMERIVRQDPYSKPNNKRQKIVVPEEIPDLPQPFKERIQQLNGSKMGLVIQKRLFQTDVSSHHYRLSIPVNQVVSSTDFLTDEEKRVVENKGNNNKVKVMKLIEPLLEECEMELGRWEMPKGGKDNKGRKKVSYCYVLTGLWNEIQARNNLKINDLIQIWKFRSPDEELCLALVVVDNHRN